LADDVITNLADEYNRTPAQVILRWQLQKGVATIPKSSSAEHLRSNAAIFDWELDSADVERIDNIDQRERTYLVTPDHDTYGIHQ
jgi:diketogulonate reductase-like aldo/keto reductase